jgi:hypothetical protein
LGQGQRFRCLPHLREAPGLRCRSALLTWR